MKGIVAAYGMAMAPAHIINQPAAFFKRNNVKDKDGEIERFREGVRECYLQIERLMESSKDSFNSQTIDILDFQLLLLEDTDFIGKMEKTITAEGVNAEYAVQTAASEYMSYLEGITDNDYIRGRAADISDLTQRLAGVISGTGADVCEPDGAYIAIGTDIAPSRIAELNKSKLKGIILEKGGVSSHCVILSKSLGIPCLIETSGILEAVKPGEKVLLDAVSGEASINPDKPLMEKYIKYIADEAEKAAGLKEYINRESVTPDGAVVKVYANITVKDEAAALVAQGGEGIGLFRSELLYMSQTGSPPDEERQYAEYRETATLLSGRPLIIRTLDIGGDKQIDYMDIGAEDNPFLGYRAIRYCLDHPEIFKPQLSAILRAGSKGNVAIMFPMITGLEEIRSAKRVVEEVKVELTARGEDFDPNIKIGIMVETPAAAFDAERIAKEVDFFSIGTNDLTQYLFAADRANTKVANLNSHFQPTLLRVVDSVTAAAHTAGIEVDVCGQAAEVEELIPLWIAMGVDILSVSIPRITAVRRRICNTRKADCVSLLNHVLQLDTAEEIERKLKEFIKQRSLE